MNDLVHAIASVEPPEAREQFRAQLRQVVVASAITEWSEKPRVAWWTSLVPRSAIAASLIVAILLAGTGVATAASLPGDPTYGLKNAYERVELGLAFDDAARVEVLARQADRRLDELARFVNSGSPKAPTASEAYQAAVRQFEDALAALKTADPGAKKDAALEVAQDASAKHIAILEELAATHTSSPGLQRALDEAKGLQLNVPSPDSRPNNAPRTPRPSPARGKP